MDIEQQQIREFMDKAGQSYPTTPSVPDQKTIELRLSLIFEEFQELVGACGYELEWDNVHDVFLFKKWDNGKVDMVEVADALTDINYVTKGAGIAFGMDLEPIFDLVQKSNMAKFGPGGYRRDDGKWMKPMDWKKPNIAGELARQMNAPDVNEAIDNMVEAKEDERPLGRISSDAAEFEKSMKDSNARVLGRYPVSQTILDTIKRELANGSYADLEMQERAALRVWQNDLVAPTDGLMAETIAHMRGENHSL